MMNPLAISRRVLLAAAASSLLLTACGKSEDKPVAAAPEAIVETAELPEKIIVGLDDNFPPMGFRGDNNELVGFDVDLARETGKRLGIEVDFKPIDWNAKEAELNGKRIDVLWNGLTITDERKKVIAFTEPYMENHQIVIVKADSDIYDKADMADKTIGAQDGSSAIDAIEKDADVAASFKSLKKYGDNVTALMDLDAGRLDAVVLDEVVGRYYIAKQPEEYRVLEENFGTEEYGVGLRKDDEALHQRLDEVLIEVKTSPEGQAIAEKWFGKNIFE